MQNSKKRIVLSLEVSGIFILFLILIHFTGETLSLDLYKFGVYPREVKGIAGILTHPLIHSSWKHLFTNCSSLFFLLAALIYFYKDWAYLVLAISWIGEGILLFIIGRANWHIGASGIIYALAFFLFFSGIFSRTKSMTAISLLMVFLYGSMVWSIMPYFVENSISWEGHLSGAITGFFASIFLFSKTDMAKQEPVLYNDKEDEELYIKWTQSLEPPKQENIKEEVQPGNTVKDKKEDVQPD